MVYPEFNTDLLLTVDKPPTKIYVDKNFSEKLVCCKLTIDILEIDRKESYLESEWSPNTTFINLYFSDKFILEHFIPSSPDLILFLESFKNFIKPFTNISCLKNKFDFANRTRPLPIFSTFYKSKDDFLFQFLFEIDGDETDYINALTDVFKTVIDYNTPESNDIQEAIKESYAQSNRIKYLLYLNKQWTVVNPLLEVGREINSSYIKNKDLRIKKPIIVIHKDDYRKVNVLHNNCVLTYDSLETLMIQPNDVSLYSNISINNLKQAETFYKETILPRYKQDFGTFPSLEKQKDYYNYFEFLISSLIFAYTSLEAFANICIPESFEYKTEKDGIKTIYSKAAIERKFSLKDKFKYILKNILNTPEPTKEKWWNQFIDLENLRDEIIHTKQSKSEDRYSRLISKKIFKSIQIHKEIIKYYGYYIAKNKKELLYDYPYNFGYDDIFPEITDELG